MRITADANLIVRLLTGDQPIQAAQAQRVFLEAEAVALPTSILCEVVWVIGRGYKIPQAELLQALRKLTNHPGIISDRSTVEAGFTMMELGGGFADGAIAHEGRRMGGEVFVSFDRKAVQLLKASGVSAQTPA